MPRPPEYKGTRFTIYCLVLPDGTCPAGEFLDGLDEGERRKLDVLFERLGEKGSIPNTEQFKKLEGSDGIWEFKRRQIRLFCFFATRRRVVLAYGLKKKRDRHARQDIERAEAYKSQFESKEGKNV